MVSFKWDNERAIQIAKEEYLAIGEERGEARGVKIALTKIALRMLRDKLPLSLITTYTGLTPNEVWQIAKENGLTL